jgi:NAD+ kinase
VESRSLIEARRRGAPARAVELALNDFVISRGAVPRLIELEVRVDGELLTSYRGDGLIISSPTGSTAYSLAAGGAVVSPQAEVFALTPICPHTLSNRSVIVSLAATVEVNVRSQRVETYLAADGQPRFQLKAGDRMGFQRSRHTAPLVRLPGTSFFDTLRQKMNWSGSPV